MAWLLTLPMQVSVSLFQYNQIDLAAIRSACVQCDNSRPIVGREIRIGAEFGALMLILRVPV